MVLIIQKFYKIIDLIFSTADGISEIFTADGTNTILNVPFSFEIMFALIPFCSNIDVAFLNGISALTCNPFSLNSIFESGKTL